MGKSKLTRTPGFAMDPSVRNQVLQQEIAPPSPDQGLATQTDINQVNEEANSAPQIPQAPPSIADEMMQALSQIKAAGYDPAAYKLQKSGVIPPVPPQLMAKVAPLVLQSAAEMKQQGDQRVSRLDDLYNQYAAQAPDPNGPNYAGLLALADTFGNGNTQFSKNYKTPRERSNEFLLKQADLQKQILKEQTGLSDKAIDDMIKYMGLNNSANMAESAMVKGEGTQDRFESGKDLDVTSKVIDWKGKEVDRPFQEDKQKFDTIDAGLKSNDYQMVMNTLSNFSRSVAGEKGVLTDTDIARVMPANYGTTWARLEAYFNDTPSAKLDPVFTQKLQELVKVAKEKTIQKYNERLDLQGKTYDAAGGFYRGKSRLLNDSKTALDTYKKSFSGLSEEKKKQREALLKKQAESQKAKGL